MEKEIVTKLHKSFEDYMHTDENGVEFWYARELQELLEYAKWDTFKNVIERAKDACKNSGQQIVDHFPDVGKMVQIGSGTEREQKEIGRASCRERV